MGIKIFDDLAEAGATILKRVPLDEYPISSRIQEGIRNLFGEDLTAEQAVQRIIRDVRTRDDDALLEWTERLDRVALSAEQLAVTSEDIQKAYKQVDDDLIAAMCDAADRIEAFHRSQPITSWLDTNQGGVLGQMVNPISRVGVYGPAGTAPLPSSIMMSAIPARVAGVDEIVVCSPPMNEHGDVNPLMLVAANISGVDTFYRVGGAQAIAALAYGTATIRPVDMIVGPGNIFVVLAKRAVFGTVGIDGIPGPTETMVIADGSANPAWVAADLLAQAEHDVLASAILLTPDRELAEKVQTEVAQQVEILSRRDIIAESLKNKSGIVMVDDLTQAVAVANDYAAEHLCLLVENPWQLTPQIKNAGGVFLGEYSFEVLGDYVAGPSHVMPTSGTARFMSPLNVLDFVKLTSLVSLDQETAVKLSKTAAQIADAEGLTAHAAAARFRSSE